MRTFRRFLRDRRANIGLLLGFSLIPIVASIGGAVDLARIVRAKDTMQTAVDAAALSAANKGGYYTDAMKATADGFFNSNVDGKLLQYVSARELTVATEGNAFLYTYKANVSIPTTFLQIVGIDDLSSTLSSTTTTAVNPVEIALVLDTTGSMRGVNIEKLKEAVGLFLDKLEPNKDSVKISIVPFDTQVRLENVTYSNPTLSGPENPYDEDTDCSQLGDAADRQACTDYQATLEESADDDDDCSSSSHRQRRGRGRGRGRGHGHSSSSCSTDSGGSKSNDDVSENNDLLGTTEEEWSGCVIDRTQPYDVSSVSPDSSNLETTYPKADCARDTLKPILPLTNNFTKLREHLTALEPAGNTNITIGLQWGMETLTLPHPFNETEKTSKIGMQQFIILVTDGYNTQNRWTTRTSDIDDRTRLACTEAKSFVDAVYVIRLVNGNASLLQSCASSASKYYDVADAANLVLAFRAIGAEISKLRITR